MGSIRDRPAAVGDINPGFPPNRRNRLNDPARQIGGQDRGIAQMAARLGALERLLSSYREKQVEVRNSDGTFQTVTVLAKEGGESPGGSFGTTIQPKELAKVAGVWTVTFHPARMMQHSLTHAGQAHDIKTSKGTLESEPKLPLGSGTQDVWLRFDVSSTGSIVEGTPELVIGKEPDRKLVVPQRPETPGSEGSHVQHVGQFITADGKGAPKWKPINTSAIFSTFFTAIESVGDGERIYDAYQNEPPTDKFRSLRGQNESELNADGYTDRLEKEFIEDQDYPAFEIRELPLKVIIEVKSNSLVFKGFCKVPVPAGFSGDYNWKNCGESAASVKAQVARGLVLNTGDAGGDYNACGCDNCDGTTTYTPGP